MGKRVASEFLSLLEKSRQVLHGKYLAAWRGLIHQAKGRVVGSCDSKPFQYASASANCRSRKVIKCK